MQHPLLDSRLADLALGLTDVVFGEDREHDLTVLGAFMRGAYGRGYVDAMTDEADLRLEEPIVAWPELLLP